ncbi:MAG: tRNA lysidine(34) synthetase TilS, partial [Lachnospiraceae bacterium]|nr:tRNA lysidine(34) synthetase TilS [Lachnospiraceae bacterium]
MKRILEYIEEHKLINDNDNIVIGLSGGADSVCLLYVLTTLRKEKDIHIKAVHINHMIRETAARDEDFSRDLSYQLNVDYVSDKTDCIGISKRDSISVEEAGRNERYRIFKKVGDETFGEGNYKIAVAHHMDDLAETFIFNMTRGTGIAGLTSVKPVSGNIIRPLLCITKKDIEEILTNAGLKHVEDETNSLDDYARNKIRHNVIPVLNEVTQSATEHIAMLSERLSDIEDYLDNETDEAYQKYCTVRVLSNRENTNSQLDEIKEVTISEEISTLHKAIAIRVIHRALIEVAGRARDIASVQIEAVENLFDLEAGKKRDLIYNMEAIREKEGVLIRKKKDASGDGEVIVDNEKRANLLES